MAAIGENDVARMSGDLAGMHFMRRLWECIGP